MLDPHEKKQLALSTELVVAARAWRRIADHALGAFSISSSSSLPLLMIGRLSAQGVRQVTLAQAVGIEGPSLVRVLDQLCTARLVRRDEDPADKRAKIVSLTDAGRELVQKIEGELVNLRAKVLHGVSDADLETTLRVVKLFNLDPGLFFAPAVLPAT